MNEKTAAKDELEQSFNDDELADIMSEIESLEKEFVEESSEEKVEVATEALETEEISQELLVNKEEVDNKKTDLQAEIDSEIETMLLKPEEKKITPKAEVKEIKVEADPLEEAILALQAEENKAAKTPEIVQAKKEEVIEVFNNMDNVVPLKEVKTVEKNTTTVSNTNSNPTQLDFSVSGQMNLKLNFTISGQTVTLYVNESEGMVIEMMGGAKFTLPMAHAVPLKKAV